MQSCNLFFVIFYELSCRRNIMFNHLVGEFHQPFICLKISEVRFQYFRVFPNFAKVFLDNELAEYSKTKIGSYKKQPCVFQFWQVGVLFTILEVVYTIALDKIWIEKQPPIFFQFTVEHIGIICSRWHIPSHTTLGFVGSCVVPATIL